MIYKIRIIIFLYLGISFYSNAQLKVPRIFGNKRSGTQWYGDPVRELKLKNNYNIYSTVGLGGGTSNYYGDFTSYRLPFTTILKTTRFNFSTNYTKHFSYNWAARVALTFARITGDDYNFKNAKNFESKYYRGLHFRNDLKEITLVGIHDFTRYRKGGYTMRPIFTPFVFGGIAVINHNPKARDEAIGGVVSKNWLKLREFDTEGQSDLGKKQYSTIAFAIPLGGGIRYKIADQFDVTAEVGFRYTFSEGGKYLDDVSDKYIASSGTVPNPTLSEKFSYRSRELYAARNGKFRDNVVLPVSILPSGEPAPRGNGRQDLYFLTAIQLNYYIPGNIKCR